MKKLVPLALSLLLLTSCGSDTPQPIDFTYMTELEKEFDSDLPLYDAAELYETEKCNFDAVNIGSYTPGCFDGEKLYLFGGSYDMWHDEASAAQISTHNVKTGEEEIIYEEFLGENDGLWFSSAGIYDNVLYWYRSAYKDYTRQNTELYRMDLSDKIPERVLGFGADLYFVFAPVRAGKMLYIEDYGMNSTNSSSIYRIDTESGKGILFRRDASTPLPWKNGIIYLHDGGFYYNGPDKIPQSGIFYEEDELLFTIDELFEPSEERKLWSVCSNGQRLYYHYTENYDNYAIAKGFFCEYDPDRKKSVCLAGSNKEQWGWPKEPAGMIAVKNLIWFNNADGIRDPMLVYDTENSVFGQSEGQKGIVSENGILVYNIDWQYDYVENTITTAEYVIDGEGIIFKP